MTPPATAPEPTVPDAPAETSPLAVIVHDGNGPLPETTEQLVIHWLKANRINPAQVAIQHPILVLPVPVPGDDEKAYLVQVIAFHQFYVGPDGDHENNLLTRRAVCFQRTVPLTVAFPTLPAPAEQPAPDGQSDDAPDPGPDPVPEEGEQ